MVDHGRVRRLLDRLRLETDRLRSLADRPTEELLNDDVVLGSAQFRFLLAIEVCVDIGRHIIAAEGLSAADTYADVFTSLADAEIIAASQVESLRAMARFRNRLVHLYDETDDAEIVKALQHDLGDLELFRQQIAEFLLRN
ncbi:MAG: type VII toxin-antitoxin system HepT family RNase toxin [Pseudonocardiales bacterium]